MRNVRRETRQVEYVPWRGQLLVTKSLGRIILYVLVGLSFSPAHVIRQSVK